jgi:hypothetical protein
MVRRADGHAAAHEIGRAVAIEVADGEVIIGDTPAHAVPRAAVSRRVIERVTVPEMISRSATIELNLCSISHPVKNAAVSCFVCVFTPSEARENRFDNSSINLDRTTWVVFLTAPAADNL